jgi:hypothetical protein
MASFKVLARTIAVELIFANYWIVAFEKISAEAQIRNQHVIFSKANQRSNLS